jgi:putative ABC transport system permease protein
MRRDVVSDSLRLAWRNVLRNARRTALSGLAIASATAALIVFGGFVEFTFWGLRESTIHTQIGHVQLHREGWAAQGGAATADHLVEDFAAVRAALSEIPEVRVITARLTFAGLVTAGARTLAVRGVGVLPTLEERLATFETLVDGRVLSGGPPDGGIVGSELAKALGVRIGDRPTLLTTTRDGALEAEDFELVGIAQSGSLDFDSVFVKVPLPMVQRLLRIDGVESIVLLLDDTRHTGRVAAHVRRLNEEHRLGLEVATWDELAPFYHRVTATYRALLRVVAVIIVSVVLFGIANTMTMAVLERIQEIGTLRALGATRARVLGLLVTEGAMIGALGACAGVASGVGIGQLVNLLGGIDIPPPPGMSRGYTALIQFVPAVIAWSLTTTVIVASVSSLYPALKAVRPSVAESLRHS